MAEFRNASIESIDAVALECSQSNWDGYSAVPVLPETIERARRFLDALPIGTHTPTAGADPDGDVTLEWYCSPRRTLSVSITPNGELNYAALIGSDKAYGTEPFLGEIPKPILELIVRIKGHL